MKQRGVTPYLYTLPALILFVLVILVPTGFTAVFSVVDWQRFQPHSFGTFEHYERLVIDPTLGKAFSNNFLYIFYTIVLEVGIGLGFAGIAIHLKRSLLFRSLIFAPVILPSIVTGVLWRQAFAFQSGLVNTIIGWLGVDPVQWLGPPFTVFSVSIVSGWIWSGFFMTIFYAGLIRIPRTYVESAILDGASRRRIFFTIQVPLIRNLLVLALLIVTTGGFKGFDLFKILLRRDPLESGVVLPTYLVRVFFENQDIGYGSAVSVILTVVVLLIMGVIGIVRKLYVGEIEEY
mgnify:CR=1 FL=1